jgi:hypothetical protein
MSACLHLGPPVLPRDSSCAQLCSHRCEALRRPVRPKLDCGDRCPHYRPDDNKPEEKRPQ